MKLTGRLPSPATTHRGSGIYPAGIGFFPVIYKFSYPWNPSASGLITYCEHAEGWVITIVFHNSFCLLPKIVVDWSPITKRSAVIWPAGSFRLQVKSNNISSFHCGLRRTIRVKPHVIKSVAAANTKHSYP